MPKNAFSRLSVLVADSNPQMIGLIASMLRSLGVQQIREATDAAAATTLLDAGRFDAVILDDDLAGMDGLALTRALRLGEDGQNRYVPVIMMARAPDAAHVAAARDAGVTEFLRKPFSARLLKTRLEAVIGQPRSFIVAESFAGPDRRRRARPHEGEERRNGPYAGPDRRAR